MESIPIEIKCVIASFDEEAWYKLYLYDAAFAKEARMQYMINRYIDLFTECVCGLTKLFGKLNSINDQPTLAHDCARLWYKNGLIHRDGDKPAVICANGARHWYQNGRLHREGDKPAEIYANGTQFWYKNGQLHREGDKPAVVYVGGDREWWINGRRIR